MQRTQRLFSLNRRRTALFCSLVMLLMLLTACAGDISLTAVPSRPPGSSTLSPDNSLVATTREASSSQPPVKAAPGFSAPDFSGLDINGQPVHLRSLLTQGKAVMLNFWSVYCAPCRQEVPELLKVYQANQSRLVVIGVDLNDTPEETRSFMREFKMDYPVLIDTTGDLVYQYRVRGRPTSFFINRDGVITGVVPGPLTSQLLDQELAKGLK